MTRQEKVMSLIGLFYLCHHPHPVVAILVILMLIKFIIKAVCANDSKNDKPEDTKSTGKVGGITRVNKESK